MAQVQETWIEIPEGFTPTQRNSLGLDIISFIQALAINENRGFNSNTGRKKQFPRYEKEYAKKKRTSVSNVDLVLSSNMFNAMKVKQTRKDAVLIGFRGGSRENGKAEGNQIGSYGQPFGNPSKARPFLGITKGDLLGLVTEFKKEVSIDN